MKQTGGKVSIMLANSCKDWGNSLSYSTNGDSQAVERNKFIATNSFFTQSGTQLSMNQISFDLYVFG